MLHISLNSWFNSVINVTSSNVLFYLVPIRFYCNFTKTCCIIHDLHNARVSHMYDICMTNAPSASMIQIGIQ